MQPSYDFTYAVLVLITLGSCNLSTKKFNIFVCNNVIYRRNLFGRNGKLNPWLERGQIDSIFRINYTHPWIEGDDKRASRAIMIQVPNVLLPNVQLIIHLICLLHKLIFVSSTIRIQECQEHLFMEIMLTVTAIWLGTSLLELSIVGHFGQNGMEQLELFFRCISVIYGFN